LKNQALGRQKSKEKTQDEKDKGGLDEKTQNLHFT